MVIPKLDPPAETWYHEGREYSPIFDAEYYLNKYPDLKAAFGDDHEAAFNHFIVHGMKEGRQASPNFDVHFYKDYYDDLQKAFGGDLVSYYIHYLDHGQYENRKTVEGGEGSEPEGPGGEYPDDGFDAGRYELVFNANYYLERYPDLRAAFGTDKAKAFQHFLQNGMKEARRASVNFDVVYYRAKYADLEAAFGND